MVELLQLWRSHGTATWDHYLILSLLYQSKGHGGTVPPPGHTGSTPGIGHQRSIKIHQCPAINKLDPAINLNSLHLRDESPAIFQVNWGWMGLIWTYHKLPSFSQETLNKWPRALGFNDQFVASQPWPHELQGRTHQWLTMG